MAEVWFGLARLVVVILRVVYIYILAPYLAFNGCSNLDLYIASGHNRVTLTKTVEHVCMGVQCARNLFSFTH